jgi:hypothetical protein
VVRDRRSRSGVEIGGRDRGSRSGIEIGGRDRSATADQGRGAGGGGARRAGVDNTHLRK